MQLKKFEAATMQEALKLVKKELGPDAVILGAREISKGLGLLNSVSVEITAAVSESTLRKKQYVESRLKEENKQKFAQASAPIQKQVIDKVVGKVTQRIEAQRMESQRRQVTSVPYASIQDDEYIPQSPVVQSSANYEDRLRSEQSQRLIAQAQEEEARLEKPRAKIKSLAQEAFKAASPLNFVEDQNSTGEINTLKNEILRLQKMIKGMTPQSPVSLHTGANYGVSYDLNFMFERLVSVGIEPELASQVMKAAQKDLDPLQLKKKPMVDAYTAKWILDHSKIQSNPFSKGVHLFMGPNGAGKTSTLVKMASYLMVQKKGSVAILTTDTFKVGAADQLRIYCKILNVPFAVVRTHQDWSYLKGELQNVEYILADYPGLQMTEISDIDQIRELLPVDYDAAHKHLVLPVTMKDSDAYQMAQRYKHTKFNDVIFTNLDQSLQHGLVLNLPLKMNVPIHSFSIGSQIPEDFEPATKERILDLIFKLSKIKSGRSAT